MPRLKQRSLGWFDDAKTDVRYALRGFVANPGITVVALLMLAIGIGASTAIVSAVNAVLLKPPAYPTADRLVAMWERRPTGERNAITTRSYLAYTGESSVFERAAPTVGPFGGVTLTDGEQPVWLRAFRVGASYFDMLGASATLGRTFVADDDLPGRNRVVVLSHALWTSQFGSDPTLIGRPIQLDKEAYTVVGVMPPNSPFDRSWVQLWLPQVLGPDHVNRTDHWMFSFTGGALALLKPGVTLERARAELDAVSARLAATYPDTNRGWGVDIESYGTAIVGDDLRQSLYLLLGAVGCVLLLACVNLAHVLTTRGMAREGELAIRAALGAGRGRIVRQFLTEAVVLSVSGGLMGVALAYGALQVVIAALPRYTVPAESVIAIDVRVLVFAATLSVAVGIACGVLPAIWATRRERMSMGAHHRASAPLQRRQVLSALIISEVALAMVLLVGAGLLVRSFLNMREDDGGITSSNLLTAYVPVRDTRVSSPEQLTIYFRRIADAIQSVPGVDAVAVTDGLPFRGAMRAPFFQIVGHPSVDRSRRPVVMLKAVSGAYFGTLGLRVRKGRALGEQDRAGSAYVVVINETMARRYFSDEDPLGQHLLMQETRPGTDDEIPWEVVGVIADERIMPFSDKRDYAVAYVPVEQSPTPMVGVVVHTALDPVRAEAAVRHAVFTVNKDQPLIGVGTMEQLKSGSMESDRLRFVFLSVFATVAVLLAAIGLYGMVSYAVERRTHEIGIRSALGGTPRQLVGLMLRHGLVLTAAGLLVGALGAFGLARLLTTLLFGVAASDPTTIVGATSILTGVAAIACYVPARQLTKVDPLIALRRE